MDGSNAHSEDLFQLKAWWADGILTKDWGKSVRAKIIFRREHNREPTSADPYDETKRYDDVTIQEIIDSFNRGEQVNDFTISHLFIDTLITKIYHVVYRNWGFLP